MFSFSVVKPLIFTIAQSNFILFLVPTPGNSSSSSLGSQTSSQYDRLEYNRPQAERRPHYQRILDASNADVSGSGFGSSMSSTPSSGNGSNR